jgi:hypothetical protein
MWNFVELRACLIPLAEKVLGDVDKIVCAREFHVDQWTTPAYIKLCQREEPLTSEEAAKIGLEGTLLIFRIRERPGGYSNTSSLCSSTSCRRQLTFQAYCNYCGCYRNISQSKVSMSEKDVEERINAWVKNGRIFTNDSK